MFRPPRIAFSCIAALALCAAANVNAQTAQTVSYPGLAADGFSIVGYVYRPNPDLFPPPYPAIVLMHGRVGAYGDAAKSGGCDGQFVPNNCYNINSLAARHTYWASRWQQLGYLTIMVDGFGSRGSPEGFAVGTFSERAVMFDPKVARVGDAYATLAYLRTRPDVIPNRIGIQGWSNGGMTTLNTMGVINGFLNNPTPTTGFRAALSYYPGCTLSAMHMKISAYMNYAPMIVFNAQDDDDVDPVACANVTADTIARGGPLAAVSLPDTDHNFDDPIGSTQNLKRNRPSTAEARRRSELFFQQHLKN